MSKDNQKNRKNEDKSQEDSQLGGGSFMPESGKSESGKSGSDKDDSKANKKEEKREKRSKRFERMIKKAEEIAAQQKGEQKDEKEEEYLQEQTPQQGEVISKDEKVKAQKEAESQKEPPEKQEKPPKQKKEEVVDTFSKDEQDTKLEFEEDGSVTEEQIIDEEEERGFFGKISDFLAEAGIDSRQIITGCIFLLFIGGVIYGLVWGYKKFFGDGEAPSVSDITEIIDTDEVEEEISELTPEELIIKEREAVKSGEKTGITSAYTFGYDTGTQELGLPPQIGVSFVVGRSEREFFADTFAPIQTAFYYGQEGVQLEHDFVAWIDILQNMKNAYDTDLEALLDNSFDRASTLDEYLLEIKRIDKEAKDAYGQIYETADILKTNLNEATEQKQLYEEDFFVAVDDLSGEKSEFLLLEFIDLAQYESEIKARYNALIRLRDMYEGFMEDFDRRIFEIEANKEALIEGIKVLDVGDSSSLDIIIPLDTDE